MTTIANIKVMMRTKPGGQNHILYSGSRTNVVDVVTHVVDEEVTKVGEEGCRCGSRRWQQSQECAPQKPDRPSPVQDHERRGSEDCCPFSWCTPEGGLENNCAAALRSGTVRNHMIQLRLG